MGCENSNAIKDSKESKPNGTKILLVLSHTDYENSFANKEIVNKLMTLIPNIELDHVDKIFSDSNIDIKKEQDKLVKSDIIIFQFPLFWYNAPSSLRKWIEVVFQHGFSHGAKGKSLNGKKLLISLTTGAPEQSYKEEKDSIENLMHGMECLCRLCGMKYLGVVYTFGVSYLLRDKPELLNERTKDLEKHAQKVADIVKSC